MNEFVCEDCMEGDHEACRRQGGWPFQETNERCGCHDTAHRFDNRTPHYFDGSSEPQAGGDSVGA